MLLFALSLLLSLAVSGRIARLTPIGPRQFWLALGAFVLPWGLLANLLSVFHALTPLGWLAGQAALSAAIFAAARRWRWPLHPFAKPVIFPPLELALATALSAVLALEFLQQLAQPLWIGDEIRYHASRVLYWIGQQSIFPYPTHNDRQTYFAYQGELAFLWPVLLTRLETASRLVFWLGSPLACIGVFLVSRRLGAARLPALLVTLWFALTPIILRHGYGLKPEMWLAVFFLGTVWWLLEGLESNEPIHLIFSGAFCALALSTKLNFLAVVPFLLAIPWLAQGVSNRPRSFRALLAGLIAASLLSGIALLLLFNTIRGGHPLGPAGMREVHSADISARQLRTHFARLPLLLFEPPAMPSPGAKSAIELAGRGFLAAVDAAQPLALEKPEGWPGQFVFSVPPAALNYSLGGIALLALLLLGPVRLAQEWRRTRQISANSAVWLLLAALLAAVLIAVRWMVHSGLPERFLIPSFAVAMTLLPGLFPSRLQTLALAACLALAGLFPTLQLLAETKRMWTTPPSDDEVLGQFAPAMDHIPPGSHILFFGNQDAPDYPLFAPATGFDRRVTAWGKAPFDPAALESLLARENITHLLFQDPQAAYFHWDPPLPLNPFIQWASQRLGARVPPLEGGRAVLIALRPAASGHAPAARPRQLLSEAPASSPLVSVDREIRSSVGIDAGRMATPWPIENLGPDERGYLWIGSGPDEGLKFRVWSEEQLPAAIRLRVGAGPSRSDSVRNLILRTPAGQQLQLSFSASGEVTFPVELNKGLNPFSLFSPDPATVPSMPNGDTRHLIVGLRDVFIESANKISGALVRAKGLNIESGSLKSPWAIDDPGPPENEFLWLGSGEAEGLAFAIATPNSGTVVFKVVASPGPSRGAAGSHLALRIDGKPAGEQQIAEKTTLEFRAQTSPGRHEVKFYAKDPPTVLKLANGDPRKLIAGLHEITLEAVSSK
jgi:hypothetical protein